MTFKNLPQFQKKLKKRLERDVPKNLGTAMFKSALLVKEEAINSIRGGGKTGRIYIRGGKEHTASAAGQAPATDTGILISGISHEVKMEGKNVVGKITAFASDGSGGNYAKHLEFGTTNMGERPFMQPALNKNARKIERIFKRQGLIK